MMGGAAIAENLTLLLELLSALWQRCITPKLLPL